MSGAAESLFLTQPGLSNSIKILEEELNLKLLNRNRNGVTPTIEGEKIYKYTLQLEKIHEALIQEAQNLNGLKTGIVNVGSFSSITMSWLPQILSTLQHDYPDIKINIHEGDYESLEKMVLSGELDCCFNTPPDNNILNFSPLIKDELLCIVSEKHPLSNEESVSINDLFTYDFIKPKKNWDNEINKFFSSHNLEPNIRYEISEDASIMALVEANLGINIRPKLVLDNRQSNKKIKIVKFKEEAYRILGICSSSTPSHATKIFIDYAKNIFLNIENTQST